MAHELVDEQRVALGLAGDALGISLSADILEQELDELAGIVIAEVTEAELAKSTRNGQGRHRPGLGPRHRPQRRQDQHGRRVGRCHQGANQVEAVGVGPLQVVDGDYERHPHSEAVEELAQRLEDPYAQLMGIRGGAARTRRPGEFFHTPQHRKHPGQERGLEGEHSIDGAGLAAQIARQRVDDPVHGLEGDGLTLVAAPRQHHYLGELAPHALDEGVDQGALANPGSSGDNHGSAVTCTHRRQALAELGELARATDEGGNDRRRR